MLYSILCTHSGIWDQRTQISVTPNPSSLGTRLSAVPEGSGTETITLLPTAEWWMQIWKVLGRLSQNEWDHSVYRVIDPHICTHIIALLLHGSPPTFSSVLEVIIIWVGCGNEATPHTHTFDTVMLILSDVGLVTNWWKDVTEHIFMATSKELRIRNSQFSLSLHISFTANKETKRWVIITLYIIWKLT